MPCNSITCNKCCSTIFAGTSMLEQISASMNLKYIYVSYSSAF